MAGRLRPEVLLDETRAFFAPRAAAWEDRFPDDDLADLARVVRPGGRLVLFHPSGRAALAARHGRRLRDDDLLAPGPLDRLLQGSGWSLAGYDDGPDRFLAQADRITLGT